MGILATTEPYFTLYQAVFINQILTHTYPSVTKTLPTPYTKPLPLTRKAPLAPHLDPTNLSHIQEASQWWLVAPGYRI